MMNNIKKMIPEKYKPYLKKVFFPLEILEYQFKKNERNIIYSNNKLRFYSDVEVVNQVVNDKKSLARFGDGEMLWTLNVSYPSYQIASEELANRLREVLTHKNDKLIIGLPNVFDKTNLNKYVFKSRVHWTKFLVKWFDSFNEYVNPNNIYADTQMTRCYIDFKEKAFTKEKYDNLKRMWENRDLLIVEGNKTRMGVGNDLFSNAKSIERLICPAKDAFSKYDEILSSIKKFGKNKLVILALGPTATVLAYDICNMNNDKIEYQALDLGHIDVEYEWFLLGAKKRTALKGKFVNEVRNKDYSNNDLENKAYDDYKNSIIAEIKLED